MFDCKLDDLSVKQFKILAQIMGDSFLYALIDVMVVQGWHYESYITPNDHDDILLKHL